MESDFLLVIAVAFKAYNPRGSALYALNLFLDGKIAITGVFAVIARDDFIGFLEFAELREIFACGKIRISKASFDETFDDDAVNIRSHALLIWAVIAFIAIDEISFVSNNAEFGELLDEFSGASSNGALSVGILKPEHINATAIFGNGIS